MKIKFYFLFIFLLSLAGCESKIQKIDNEELKKILPNFQSVDIGIGKNQSFLIVKDSIITIHAGGNDIWGKRDSFNYMYLKTSGDFDFSFQLKEFKGAVKYSKIGIMARKELSSGSQHVYFLAFSDNSSRNNNQGGFEFQYREHAKNISKAIYPDVTEAGNKHLIAFPEVWIRMIRNGDYFESLHSRDNKNWISYSKFHMRMPKELFLGVAITSNDKIKMSSAKMSNFKLVTKSDL